MQSGAMGWYGQKENWMLGQGSNITGMGPEREQGSERRLACWER